EQLGHPVQPQYLDDINDLGAEFARWEVATSIAGSIMGVNPFDEPDVNATKIATQEILGQSAETDEQGPGEPVPKKKKMPLTEFLEKVQPADYIAILAYLPFDQAWTDDLNQLRLKLALHCNVATCLAFGPRYLHSSGQLHKGGKKIGHFLVITATAVEDVPIPQEHYGFQHLINAQAQGDIEVLQQRGQNVLSVDLGRIDRARDLLEQMMTSVPD
ncbi:MAG: hypothetical protein QNI91_06075, partial [Arenicellales bacterium]|nr:hypothetical protein [Arenicellales bacterium]